jgi:hypothetical protein
MTTMYKLVTKNFTTRNNMYWELNKTNKATGHDNKMCTDGVLHCYSSPEQAVLFNPIHARIENPVLLKIECSDILDTDGLKYCSKEQTPIEILELPVFTTEQKVAFGIKCALLVCKDTEFVNWATAWLDGTDRTKESAVYVAESVIRSVIGSVIGSVAWSAARSAVARSAESAAEFIPKQEFALELDKIINSL